MQNVITLFEGLQSRKEGRQGPVITLRGVHGGARGYVLAHLLTVYKGPVCIVTPDASQGDLLYEDLRCFLTPTRREDVSFAEMSERVYRYSPGVQMAGMSRSWPRQRALCTYQPLWRLLEDEAVIVVADAPSLQYGVPPVAALRSALVRLTQGMLCDLQKLAALLVERGYRRVSVVEEVGEFAVRGGLVDVFSPGAAWPYRLEFFDDDIETIRLFDHLTQTSIATVEQVVLAPIQPLGRCQSEAGWQRLHQYLQEQGYDTSQRELLCGAWRQLPPEAWPWGVDLFFYPDVGRFFDFLSPQALLCCVSPEEIKMHLQQATPLPMLADDGQEIPLPAAFFSSSAEILQHLEQRLAVALLQYDVLEESHAPVVVRFQGAPQFFGGLERFIRQVQAWQQEGWCLLLLGSVPTEVQHLHELLRAYELHARVMPADVACLLEAPLQSGAILLGVGTLSQGFLWPEKRLAVLRASDVFGEKNQPAPSPTRRRAFLDVMTLRPGDLVVHADYGIGRFCRMTFLEVGKDVGEFMELEYADGAKLYLPVYRLNLVQKYSGNEGTEESRLDHLGGTAWSRTKARVRAALLEMAEELVRLHAARQQHIGYNFSPPDALFREFESQFDYIETEDQLQAIQDVLVDMEQPRPMERLVCGDVGYGKTEVAMRAAFKAAYDGKQVAILVPTTVLAQQHYETFSRRFAAFPLQLAALSRLTSRKEQQRILTGLQQGDIDIVIGTHRLLQQDVQFKDLGLLVIDEEHRFGVKHKEHIKRLAARIDLLALTATPIPRSLHMAMVGLRDCSIIATPPEGRNAIRTLVLPFGEEVIQQAIQYELQRGGQIFFVHNHINTLAAMQQFLQRLVPECRIGIAHGQMPERALENLMLGFLRRDFDLLLCTTIIESGLDITAANTMIIHHAETFGLAQLYQLRGRVGRSSQQAYAYLLIPGEQVLSDTARKRIEAIEEFSELGAGFHLASRDLEIRGAGNLLGAQQSGHIASVGFDLYCQMLAEAIRTVRGEPAPLRVEPELRLPVQGYFPETYIEDAAQRLACYQRLAAATEIVALTTLHQELQDRFGPLPIAAERLFDVMEVKLLARDLAIERLEQRGDTLHVLFHPQTPLEPSHLLNWLQKTTPDFTMLSPHSVAFPWVAASADDHLTRLKECLQQLGDGARIA